MKDTLTEFIQETFGGKRSTLDQLDDEIKVIDGLTKTVERINGGLDDISQSTIRLINKKAALEDKVKLYEEALEVACEEVEGEDNIGVCPDFNHDVNWPECTMEDSPHDKGVCWKKYFLQRAQENIDREKNNRATKGGV
jgi:hypothetical protein